MFGFKKNRRRRAAGRLPRIESLETRTVFAGNIVSIFNAATGSLVLTGDAMSNAAVVRPLAGGNILVEGRAGTTINGAASVAIPAPSLGAVTVNLMAGNDAVVVNDIYMASFNLQETTGNDRVNLNNVGVGANVLINTLSGNDQVQLNGLFQGNVTINSGTQDDVVQVSGAIGVRFAAAGSKELNGNYVFGGAIGGNKNLVINTSDGNDKVILSNLDVDGRVFINTGNGNDTLNSQIVRVADSMDVRMGNDDDEALFVLNACPLVTVDMGAGDDLVNVDPFSLGTGVWSFDGGVGSDTLDRNGSALGAHVNFETLL